MSRRELARVVHDVGKYVARTARNLPEIPSDEVVDMLARDLYELRPGQRASAVLAELAVGLSGAAVAEARRLLDEADQLEPRVRARELVAVRRAAALALDVERILRAAAS